MDNKVLQKTDTNFVIDDVSCVCLENVKTYKYTLCEPTITVEFKNKLEDTKLTRYFVFDCFSEGALGHWVFESFIFYPLLVSLNKQYENIVILTSINKKYVVNSFKLIGITNKIMYLNEFAGKTENENNIVYFPPLICLNDKNVDTDLMRRYINLHCDVLRDILAKTSLEPIGTLFLPRNTIENYPGNDGYPRHGQEDIAANLIKNQGVVLNTYQINNLFLQFSIVNSANTIIVDFGSAYYFNCIFLRGKKIVLLDHIRCYFFHTSSFRAYTLLNDIIRSNNQVELMHATTITYDDVKVHL